MKTWLILLNVLVGSFLAQANIIDVPGDHATIEDAVRSASQGDTVLLAPGIYTQKRLIKIDKSITLASNFILSNDRADIEHTIINAVSNDMKEWFEIASENTEVIGIKFLGNEEHTLHITAPYAFVKHCIFIGGKDQLSITEGGGYIGHCYFEGAGDDAIDCDQSISWTIEYNTIVNAHQDGIEIRLHEKDEPLTKHIFRHNTVTGSGQSGIQMIDYRGNSYRKFYIHNNIFRNCKGAGVSCMYKEKDDTDEVYKGSLMKETAFVYNNTFDGCNYGLTVSPGLVVINNIFTHTKTIGITRGAYVNDSNDRSIVDYCLFYNNSVHYDANISIGDNNISDVDPALDNQFRLKYKSPGIDKGIAKYSWKQKKIVIPAKEFNGVAPDLGAIEFGEQK
jgi:hypothetical protein